VLGRRQANAYARALKACGVVEVIHCDAECTDRFTPFTPHHGRPYPHHDFA
jgi:hypothetical protein